MLYPKVKVSKDHANEFSYLEGLSNRLIEYSERRFKNYNRVDVKIKNVSDLYPQLAGQEFKLFARKHYGHPSSLHCKGTDKAQKKARYSCLMDHGPRKVIKRILENEALVAYFEQKAV